MLQLHGLGFGTHLSCSIYRACGQMRYSAALWSACHIPSVYSQSMYTSRNDNLTTSSTLLFRPVYDVCRLRRDNYSFFRLPYFTLLLDADRQSADHTDANVKRVSPSERGEIYIYSVSATHSCVRRMHMFIQLTRLLKCK